MDKFSLRSGLLSIIYQLIPIVLIVLLNYVPLRASFTRSRDLQGTNWSQKLLSREPLPLLCAGKLLKMLWKFAKRGIDPGDEINPEYVVWWVSPRDFLRDSLQVCVQPFASL